MMMPNKKQIFERGQGILDTTNGEHPDQIDDAIVHSSFDAMFSYSGIS